MSPRNKDKEETQEQSPVENKIHTVISTLLKKYKDDHLNDVPTIKYQVSSGSLNLDVEMGGGLGPSLVRFTGATEGGKTSCSLSFMRNFLRTVPKSRAVFFDVENRLSDEIQRRADIKFTYDNAEFDVGMCYIVVTTSYDMVIDVMRNLVMHSRESGEKFIFVIDSIDSLLPKADADVDAEEVSRMSGTQKAKLTTDFLNRLSAAMRRYGHICIFISQIRSKIIVNQYAKIDQNSLVTTASGAHSLVHAADWVIEFQSHVAKKDLMFKKVGNSDQERIIGHDCKVVLKKTPNDRSGTVVSYPIRRNAPPGKSIWKEREIIDQMIAWDQAILKGPWVAIQSGILQMLKNKNLNFEASYQGIDNLCTALEENPNVADAIFEYLKEVIGAIKSTS